MADLDPGVDEQLDGHPARELEEVRDDVLGRPLVDVGARVPGLERFGAHAA
jgi:hypothetical protein